MIDPVEQEIRTLRSIFWSNRDPDGRAFAPLADAYCRAGQFRQAVELLIDGRKRHPDFATGHAVAARVFMENGLTEEGELAARRVLELDEENVLALRLLGEALEARGAGEEASSVRARLEVLEPAAEGEVEEEPEPATAEEETAEAAAPTPEEPEADEAVMDVAALAPDESEADDDEVIDVAALAPDEPVVVDEEVMDVAALAPDEPVVVDEDVMDVAALAPDEPVVVDEEVMDVAALAPDEPVVVDEEVMDVAALAPDEAVVLDEEVMDVAALAPDEPEEPEELETADARPLVTRTMADLYAHQGFRDRALEVYRQLLEIRPDDEELRDRIASLEASLSRGTETAGEAAEAEGPPQSPLEVEGDGDVAEDTFSEHVWRTERHAEGHEVETPFAWTAEEPEEEGPSKPPISEYFQRLLSWDVESAAETGEASGDAGGDGPDGGGGEGGDATSRMHPA